MSMRGGAPLRGAGEGGVAFSEAGCAGNRRQGTPSAALLRRYFPIITSDDLTMTDTLSPTLRPRSSTASLVIADVIVKSAASSTFTCAVVAPWSPQRLCLE